MRRPLEGQKALVTGASSGLGRAMALALGEAGAEVLVNYHEHAEPAREVVGELARRGARSLAYPADVTVEEQVVAMFRAAEAELGSLDILINNAGIQVDRAFDEMSAADWRRVIEVNLTGQFLCAREAVRAFKRKGVVAEISRAAGKIVCISSVHEAIPWAGRVNYAASKGGVMMMMKSLAREVAPFRIRVNSIAPGAIRTDINRPYWESEHAREKLLKLIPYGRVGEPDDIARAAVWLSSDDSDYVHGATLFIDGGMTLYPRFGAD